MSTDNGGAARAEAIATIRAEHDRLAEGLRVTVDVVGDLNGPDGTLHMERLRWANERTLSDSLAKRESALAVLDRGA